MLAVPSLNCLSSVLSASPQRLRSHRHSSPADMQVMDALVVSLAKWTVLLDPHAPKPSVAFGDNHKARLATESIFLLANR